MPLSRSDLDRSLTDERHLGYGYSTRSHLDAAVLNEANALGLDYEGLFLWVNSKAGRWCVDQASDLIEAGPIERAAKAPAIVKRYLNAVEMGRLRFEELREDTGKRCVIPDCPTDGVVYVGETYGDYAEGVQHVECRIRAKSAVR